VPAGGGGMTVLFRHVFGGGARNTAQRRAWRL
jgi:hypothetical protein